MMPPREKPTSAAIFTAHPEADQIPEFFRDFVDRLPARLRELHQELIDRLG
jgi:hypothetical protein